MGNFPGSCMMPDCKDNQTIQVICLDGTVKILRKPLSAAQIVQELPQHLLCHSDSFYIGQKTPVLSPNDQLKLGSKYFLLPQHFFQSPLSLVSLASLISPPPLPPKVPPTSTAPLSAAPLRSIERASAVCQPFEMEKSDVGGGRLRIRVSADFITKLLEDGQLNVGERGHAVVTETSADAERSLCNTRELQRDYKQLVKSRRPRWTPSSRPSKKRKWWLQDIQIGPDEQLCFTVLFSLGTFFPLIY